MAELDPDLRRDDDVEEAIHHVNDGAGSVDDTP
jgi:hypothetical protein